MTTKPTEWTNDDELFLLMTEELYTPVIGDVLDVLGAVHQFLPPDCKPTAPDLSVIAGRAMPILYADAAGPQSPPFGLLTQALDQLAPGEVAVVTGATGKFALWGEILTATARVRGALGAVINGFHRDTPRMLEQGWPVFSHGSYAQDAAVRGRVIDYRCPVEIQGTRIDPGDLIFGDTDGVVVIPKRLERDAIQAALAKARGEKVVRKEIEGGMSSTEAFKKYEIL